MQHIREIYTYNTGIIIHFCKGNEMCFLLYKSFALREKVNLNIWNSNKDRSGQIFKRVFRQ